MCLHDETHRDIVESYVVSDRGFPYDFDAPCGKPGRPRTLAMRSPAPVLLPGRAILVRAPNRLKAIGF